MEFRDTQPIYLQISDYICEQILLRRWEEGERILSVREMAMALEVNPNTVMRTYDQLENLQIINNKRGVGFYINENAKNNILSMRRKKFLEEELPVVFKNMDLLGMKPDEIEKEYIKYQQSTKTIK